MRLSIVIIVTSIILVGCNRTNVKDVTFKNELCYNSDGSLFTGTLIYGSFSQVFGVGQRIGYTQYKNGLIHGYESIIENEIITKTYYANGKKHGCSRIGHNIRGSFLGLETVRWYYKANWKNGVKHGLETEWHQPGKSFFHTSKIKSQMEFKNGILIKTIILDLKTDSNNQKLITKLPDPNGPSIKEIFIFSLIMLIIGILISPFFSIGSAIAFSIISGVIEAYLFFADEPFIQAEYGLYTLIFCIGLLFGRIVRIARE